MIRYHDAARPLQWRPSTPLFKLTCLRSYHISTSTDIHYHTTIICTIPRTARNYTMRVTKKTTTGLVNALPLAFTFLSRLVTFIYHRFAVVLLSNLHDPDTICSFFIFHLGVVYMLVVMTMATALKVPSFSFSLGFCLSSFHERHCDITISTPTIISFHLRRSCAICKTIYVHSLLRMYTQPRIYQHYSRK